MEELQKSNSENGDGAIDEVILALELNFMPRSKESPDRKSTGTGLRRLSLKSAAQVFKELRSVRS